ncbi:IS110 family transposase [Geodermatophilus obscurus]|uniref:IS110 family transposase n=1 Tax=Geodermatophilus obscurus TaxID=1861 RepID=UPI00140FBF0E|nr:transposase [Geodermatophilus obscurus]
MSRPVTAGGGLDQLAAEAGVRLVCVQPLLVGRAREAEDFTRNKNDDSDAVIIARLVTELRCYLPERAEPAWARLRHLGARRAGLVLAAGAAGGLGRGGRAVGVGQLAGRHDGRARPGGRHRRSRCDPPVWLVPVRRHGPP